MTSIAALGHPEATVTAFADALERAFAATFDYDRVSAIAPIACGRCLNRPPPIREALR